ncbi:hypothetical protein VAL12_006981 [Pseudomonas aeruginosa]|nr:hypothetical protein [Pseudomonas aeruginosa]EMB9912502.1 hypothetical protein [Pseudomonas aeruginosa]
MYLTTQEIHDARTKYFNNVFGVSNAALVATEQLLDIFSRSGRESLKASESHFAVLESSQHSFITQFPMIVWLDECARSGQVFHETIDVMANVHKSLMQTAETQVHIFDKALMSLIRRTSNTSPAEVVPVLSVMEITIETTEQTLHGVTNAAIQVVESFDTEAHEVIDVIDK